MLNKNIFKNMKEYLQHYYLTHKDTKDYKKWVKNCMNITNDYDWLCVRTKKHKKNLEKYNKIQNIIKISFKGKVTWWKILP